MLEITNATAVVEERMAIQSDDLTKANSRIRMLEGANSQLERAKTEALNGQTTLRNDIKNLQASVKASMGITGNVLDHGKNRDDAPSSDTATAVRLTEAKYEAKCRQLNNKVEFLKSQLDSEKATAEEMRYEELML
jgi:hypothetical protein